MIRHLTILSLALTFSLINSFSQIGSSCSLPAGISGSGTYTTGPLAVDGFWYQFTVDTGGVYTIQTCGLATCDTKIYIYDYCTGLVFDEGNLATIAYNDDACGLQSSVTLNLLQDSTYYIRIGDYNTACMGENITWNIQNQGTIPGCTDPSACNYDPSASVDNGTCLYYPDSLCPQPDLMIVEPTIASSMYFDNLTVLSTDCRIDEGCLNGYGLRDILRFTTHIKNIGDQDYAIGVPGPSNPQFSNTNCHGHWHYEGYAYYALYDTSGTEIPIGYKNGFCVLDLECSGGGTAYYSCGDMGISHGCGDIYGAGLDCQFIDLTNVDTGRYQLVVRVNWDQDPDLYGHYESGYDNNVAHVCIHFTRDALGVPNFTIDPTCPIIYDCLGNPFGTAVVDCNGICDGPSIRGDQDNDSTLTQPDALMYTDHLINNTLNEVLCNDMNEDDEYTVFDVALINNCVLNGPSPTNNPCDFPHGIDNDIDTVTLSILNVDFNNQYVDIGIQNPFNKTMAYQFEMSGITIQTVNNLVSPLEYNITPDFVSGGTEVIGISYQEMTIETNNTPVPLCRIYYSSITDSVICIDNIIDIVNENYEASNSVIGGNCFAVPNAALESNGATVALNVFPNPATDIINITMGLMQTEDALVTITDGLGQVVYQRTYQNIKNETRQVDLGHLSGGVYNITLQTNTGTVTQRIILK